MMQGMMDLALEKQEVKSFAEQFDKLPGQKAGAFRAAVIELGETMELRGESLLPMQAIQAVMQRWKPFMSQTQAAQAQSPKTASGAQVVVKRPAQIPTVGGGGGASPIKAGGVKSMADIARRKEQLARQAASVAGRG
jgi:polyhydroxyalkanoate synthesis regulator protein